MFDRNEMKFIMKLHHMQDKGCGCMSVSLKGGVASKRGVSSVPVSSSEGGVASMSVNLRK